MRTLHTTLIATVVVVVALAPVGAAADSTPSVLTSSANHDRSHVASAGVVGRASRRIQVHEHFVGVAADNCQYEANVRGSLVRAESEHFVPDLVIDSNVRCLNSQGEHLTARTLAGHSFSRPELLRALADRAAVMGVADGRSCTFTPTFTIDGDRLAVRSVSQSCQRMGVGGGPDLDE